MAEIEPFELGGGKSIELTETGCGPSQKGCVIFLIFPIKKTFIQQIPSQQIIYLYVTQVLFLLPLKAQF